MLGRIAPALGLFFLSPFVAEFLLGNVSIDALPIGLVMAPMYGGGAVIVREAARRAGKGWPTIFLLALAYAVIEEGLVCQTLFNPSYFGFDLLREAYIPALGMGTWWTLFVLTLHTVWSISAPIAIIESLVPARATMPWLGWPGLVVSTILFVLGSVLIFLGTYHQEHFMATTPQLLGVVVAAAVLIAVAFAVKTSRIRVRTPGTAAMAGRGLRVAHLERLHGGALPPFGLVDRGVLPSDLRTRHGHGRALVSSYRLGRRPPPGTGGRCPA